MPPESRRSGVETTFVAVELLVGASTSEACSFHPRSKFPETSDEEVAKRRKADKMKVFISQMNATALLDG
jgi:hypothetical protein